jgi:hypothetical protein
MIVCKYYKVKQLIRFANSSAWTLPVSESYSVLQFSDVGVDQPVHMRYSSRIGLFSQPFDHLQQEQQ